jgi:hypothetical protein
MAVSRDGSFPNDPAIEYANITRLLPVSWSRSPFKARPQGSGPAYPATNVRFRATYLPGYHVLQEAGSRRQLINC